MTDELLAAHLVEDHGFHQEPVDEQSGDELCGWHDVEHETDCDHVHVMAEQEPTRAWCARVDHDTNPDCDHI